jgi:copper resistance protein D
VTLATVLVFARLAYFASATALFGGFLFEFYVGEAAGISIRTISRISRSATTALTIVAIASTMAWLVCSYVDITGDVASMFQRDTWAAFFLETSFGWVWVLRGVVLGLMIIVISWERDGELAAPVVVLAGILLVSQAWLGHAAVGQGVSGYVSICAYIIHILAGGAWIGGLMPLQRLLSVAYGTPELAQGAALRALRGFSRMGIAVVSLILVSGVINTTLRVGTWQSLFTTLWGPVLIVKLGFLAAMLACAATNRLWLLGRAARNEKDGLLLLRRSVIAELSFGLLVLSAAAVLGQLPPPD